MHAMELRESDQIYHWKKWCSYLLRINKMTLGMPESFERQNYRANVLRDGKCDHTMDGEGNEKDGEEFGESREVHGMN